MLKYILIGSILIGLSITSCNSKQNKQNRTIETIPSKDKTQEKLDSVVYQSENLIIRKISNHVYVHASFLITNSFGKVPCNGMVVANKNEAIVFDTPANEESSAELINYFTKTMSYAINAVVATHFHADCVGGLNEFHKHQVPSYANNRTIALVRKQKSELAIPQNGFDDILELTVGDKKVYADFLGEGHTKDNIIGYFPEDNVMFGGCLIKEYGAKKGNLEDANVNAWSETVEKIKQKYPQSEVIIPGHGKIGGPELLDYTIKLFNIGNLSR